MHFPGCGPCPAASQVPPMYNPMHPAYTLPNQPLPGVLSYSVQLTYQPFNVQPHHLTSAAPLSQLVPSIGTI